VPRWLWVSACSVLVAIAAVEAWRAIRLTDEIKIAETQSMQVQAERESSGRRNAAAAGPATTDLPYAQDAAAIARMAAFDAAGVLAAVESARVPGIRVTSLEINPADASARLELEVREAADLLKYLDDINAGTPASESWKLVRAQSASPTNPGTATLVRQAQGARAP